MALCAVLALSGCHRGSQSSAAGDGSTVPVRLKFELRQRPAVGQPLPIDLAVVPLAAADAATVDVADSTDFRVAAGDREFDVGTMVPNTVYRHRISVTPADGGGVLQLDVSVTLRRDEITEVRRFTVPIIVDAGGEDGAASAPARK